jgi:transcriptional regulator of NAD metabolism
MQALAISEVLEEPIAADVEATLDLAVLAQVSRGDRIEVEKIADRTLELFQRTLRIIDEQHEHPAVLNSAPLGLDRFVPEHGDLRKRFLFAEALGSYSALQDLVDGYSPAYRLSVDYDDKAQISRLTEFEIRALEDYRDQIHRALLHANEYLLANASCGYTAEELQELNEILFEARARFESLTAILGIHLIYEIEDSVRQLYAFQEKIRTVQRSIEGFFLVDSEVMFMPTNDLVRIINNLFKAVGNPFVAEHIDGMLLLAARNLLIQAVSFYSYYGKQQIYNVFKRDQAAVKRNIITHHIRGEIKILFRACTMNNTLVLKRVMNNAEREFEISVDSIRAAAERSAIEAVNLLIPEESAPPTPAPQTLLQRISSWLFR